MKTNVELEGSALTVKVEGRVDTTTAPELLEELNKYGDEITKVVLDFDKVDYLSSAGIRVLITEHKKMAGAEGMHLVNVHEIIMEVLEMTGLTDILNIQ